VAYINNIHSYDTDDNGTIDDLNMEIIKIKSGTLKANYPYLIKAKTDAEKQMNISLNNVMLFETKSTTIDCSSAYTIHNITGIYNRMSSNELIGSLAISIEGAWQPLSSDSHLNPFRLYMTITNRDDSPVKVEPAALSRVRISVLGEDSETGIEEFENENSDSQNIILDLSGRRVQNPSKGGVYIINGKVIFYLGLIAGIFSVAGNYMGAKFFTQKGAKILRPIIILVLCIFFCKILLENFIFT
jgi:hypothetical protein